MLQILRTLPIQRSRIYQVRSVLTQSSFVRSTRDLFTQSIESPDKTLFPLPPKTDAKLKDLGSIDFSVIKKKVLSDCSCSKDACLNAKGDNFTYLSLKDYIVELSCVSPQAIRRFWRVSALNPQDVLEILSGFDFNCGKFEVEVKKIQSLWGMFRWASSQSGDFKHLPQSFCIMAKMLIRVGLFKEAEYVFSSLGNKGRLLDSNEIFSDLIEGYILESDLEKVMMKYNEMRSVGLVPSASCYLKLLEFLIQMDEPQLASQLYLDMVELGLLSLLSKKPIFEKLIRLLCIHGKVQESRDLVKRLLTYQMPPSNEVLNAIVKGYCKKKDYDDIPSFFLEVGVAPGLAVGNLAINSLSRTFCGEKAFNFMQELEHLGFLPNEISFGILIGQSCREGRLTNAFIYLSELLSRNLKPNVYSYNALICGICKEGMWKQSHDILHEMKDSGVLPNLSTFKVLLAGFCKARQFSEVKRILEEMSGCGFVEPASVVDHLSAALTLLGIPPMSVKVRRDNDMKLSNTEFFDNLGNGLYLDTDLDWFDKTIDKVLNDAMLPDFNFFILENTSNRDIKSALGVVDEMTQWGQELSLASFSTLLFRLFASRASSGRIAHLLDKMSCSEYELDPGTLNILVQTYIKRVYSHKAKVIFNNMIRKKIQLENKTYTALLMGLCKRGDLRGLHNCWKHCQKNNWLPEQKDGKALLQCLWQPKFLSVALELLETILINSSYRSVDVIYVFFEKLCHGGFASTAYCFAKEMLQCEHVLDEGIYKYLFSGFCKENKPAEALTIVNAMILNKHEPPLDVVSQLITLLCRAGNFNKAVELMEAYLETEPSLLLCAYGALVRGYCRLGRFEEALFLLHEIRIKNCLPEYETCNILFQGYCHLNDLKRVGELLGIMIKKKLCMTISSYRNLVRLTCALGKISAAWSLKELIVTDKSDLAVYNILIFYLSSSRNIAAVEKLMSELQRTGLQPDRVTYDFVIIGASLCRDSVRSLHFLRNMMSEGLCPSSRSLRKVLCCLSDNGELEKALALSESMESRGWIHSSAIQNRIFEALLAKGNLLKAVNYLDRMLAKNLVPNIIDYNHIIKRLCQHGALEKASDLLNLMLIKGNVPDSSSFDYLINSFCCINNLDIALDYHTEMIYRDLAPSSITWETLVHGLTEAGRVVEAEKLIKWMVQMGETPSKKMYSSVIIKYRSLNNLEKATELIRAMQQCGYEPDFETHWSLISSYRNPTKEEASKSHGFLSTLLSGIGFARNGSRTK